MKYPSLEEIIKKELGYIDKDLMLSVCLHLEEFRKIVEGGFEKEAIEEIREYEKETEYKHPIRVFKNCEIEEKDRVIYEWIVWRVRKAI